MRLEALRERCTCDEFRDNFLEVGNRGRYYWPLKVADAVFTIAEPLCAPEVRGPAEAVADRIPCGF